MFLFPPKTAFGKTVPKSRICTQVNATRRIRDLFTKQVAEIRWAHKLSPETIHLPAKPGVPEIEVFDIQLKTLTCDEAVLETVDRAIPFPIIHRIFSEKGVAYSAAHKRPSEADSSQWVVGPRFTSSFNPQPSSFEKPLPAALDLGKLYAALLASLMPLPARPKESLTSQIARCERFRILKRQVDQLTARVHREKQFNRKVALNQKLKPLKAELKALSAL